jgi:hypothetical protein
MVQASHRLDPALLQNLNPPAPTPDLGGDDSIGAQILLLRNSFMRAKTIGLVSKRNTEHIQPAPAERIPRLWDPFGGRAQR